MNGTALSGLGVVAAHVGRGGGGVVVGAGPRLSDLSLYANADSLVTELRALVADVKARPNRYVHIRLF